MNDMDNDTSGMGCIYFFIGVGIFVIALTYYELGWSGLKMISVFLPIFPLIYWLSTHWGRVDRDEL